MEKEKPKEFPISKVMKILNSSIPNLPNNYTCDDFTVVSDATPAMASSVINFDKPYILERPRFGILYSGIVHIELNLVNHHLESPLIVFSSDKTIMKAQGFSGDVKFAFLVPSNEYVNRICNGRVPETFSGIEKDYLVPATNEDCSFLLGIINAIIALAQRGGDFSATIDSLFLTGVNYINTIVRNYQKSLPTTVSREKDLFSQFIRLVNENCHQHHELSFYADKLCLTDRYLSSMIKQASGQPAKKWIDKALIAEAQVMLRHGNETINRIADVLSFPNPSFFCKFFRERVGVTPKEYREQ